MILTDTNVLLRLVQPSHSMHPQAISAVTELRRQRHGIGQIVSFNAADFKRFLGVTAIDPVKTVAN
jgi:predicted nucleic acid-binding protein